MISMFDLYKIGIGPSSSHTVGPMKAARQFVDDLAASGRLERTGRVAVDVYGSLALTGKGHHTDVALILGLAGNLPDTVDIDAIPGFLQQVRASRRLPLGPQGRPVDFPATAITFHRSNLPRHENGLTIRAFDGEEELLAKTYYSIGGGFIVDEETFGRPAPQAAELPYPYATAAELLAHCRATGLSFSGLVLENELRLHGRQEIRDYFSRIWQTMRACMERGMATEGVLPGPLRVPRRAALLRRQLASSEALSRDPMNVVDWVNMFAFAVSEENASGGRVVTAPTNGACGIVPAVLAYYHHFIKPVDEEACMRFFLASAAIGALYKTNASISGAEVGCQGEVGVACSMAAGGLADLMGGSPEQVCVAAEVAMEHNLGLTCDPVGGQVQIPCIERNAMGAMKAINATRMALHRTSEPLVSLDKVIETMFETGKDMDPKYRETSCGGLAVKVLPNPAAQTAPQDADTVVWAA
ncbi:L-serine ammonia-lyase [Azospirillum thermophilum]|uniref:L-serine dehydratase n=1 Tax=Azospirillum thermophilum TaxID=2202148 RepID=A0A2S2CYG1_9PROT|nr:L-serine ammonia-lyase [Azospirillum thermophilum]AWK89455.1 L-serine ammonia-lyase [Azospirillum thermophilum]